MKTRERLWKLMAAMAMVLCIAACTDDDSDGNGKNNNTVPVSDADWQTVPATGGTIEKDDIAITFPSGTFTSDTKVAITNVKKGKMGGNKEASPFYQITMPPTTAKPVTVRMKSAESGDDIGYVISTRAWVTSAQEEVYHESFLETSYEDGEYLTTIPALNNGKEPKNESFIIGLGHLPQLDDTETKSPTRASSWRNWTFIKGSVEGVNWEIYVSWWTWCANDGGTIGKAKEWKEELKKEIEEAIKQIHKLGFKLNGEDRTIPYYLDTKLPDFWIKLTGGEKSLPWGAHQQDWLNNNVWSCILLDARQIAAANRNNPLPVNLKQAIIHETFHYYQSDYDPRYWSIRKGLEAGIESFIWGDDENLALCEMGSVWIEKFRDNGKLNGGFHLSQALGNSFENNFRLGVPLKEKDIRELHPGKKGKEYQQQGYALAPLLEYMLKKDNRKDKSVYDLFKAWKSEDTSWITGTDLKTPMTSRLYNWYPNWFKHAENFDSYYISLFKGEIMEDFSIASQIFQTEGKPILLENTLGKDSLVGKVYPNGCEGLLVRLRNFADTAIAKYEFVVKQKEKGVHTQVLYTINNKTVKQITGKTSIGDSIVISGETLKSMTAGMGGNKYAFLFLLTTRDTISTTAEGTIPTNTWFELREANGNAKVTPTVIEFPAYGGVSFVETEYEYKYAYQWFNPKPTGPLMRSWGPAGKYAKQIYITAGPNTTNKATQDTLLVSFTNVENGWESGYKIPVIVKQAAGPSNVQEMRKLFEGTWVSDYENDPLFQKRYVFNSDYTCSESSRTRTSESKPWGNWSKPQTGTYKVNSFKQASNCITIYLKRTNESAESYIVVYPHDWHRLMYYGYYLSKE